MARFTKTNFNLILDEIEKMEQENQNIWVPIGILEIMYNDYWGIINDYFENYSPEERNRVKLWNDIQDLCI